MVVPGQLERIVVDQSGLRFEILMFISGEPQPTADDIEWYQNDELITSESDKYFITPPPVRLIYLPAVSQALEGVFSCRVNTTAGFTAVDIPVVVYSESIFYMVSVCLCYVCVCMFVFMFICACA